MVLLLARHGHFACLWAGDSRAYLLRDGLLQRVTRDHSLVQEMINQGTLTEARGGGPSAGQYCQSCGGGRGRGADARQGQRPDHPGDALLLCSDGLFKALPEAELAALLMRGAGAGAIIDAAVERGAPGQCQRGAAARRRLEQIAVGRESPEA